VEAKHGARVREYGNEPRRYKARAAEDPSLSDLSALRAERPYLTLGMLSEMAHLARRSMREIHRGKKRLTLDIWQRIQGGLRELDLAKSG